jgi:hypothetical protein
LRCDLETLGDDAISVSAVTDPFGDLDEALLRDTFMDVVKKFKRHFVTDLTLRRARVVSSHHQRNALRALRSIAVDRVEDPVAIAAEWCTLYANLVRRHRIKGLAAFGPDALTRQLRVPGITVLRAVERDTTVGMLLWYVAGDVAYYHLGAYSDRGYASNASFALFWTSLDHFAARGLRWLSLGAGAGDENDPGDGLSRFKRGWATDTRPVWLCGRILDREAYRRLSLAAGAPSDGFFPAYRSTLQESAPTRQDRSTDAGSGDQR